MHGHNVGVMGDNGLGLMDEVGIAVGSSGSYGRRLLVLHWRFYLLKE